MEAWHAALEEGRTEAAWDQFLARYRRLMFAAIRHFTRDYDEGMDVFAQLCEKLRGDDMRRLRARAEEPEPRAQFSTWLVTVVRNHAIDWIRQRDGRRPRGARWQRLPPLQQRIVELAILDRVGHVAAFETIRSSTHPSLTFHQFQVELRSVYRAAGEGKLGPLLRDLAPALPAPVVDDDAARSLEGDDRHRALRAALARLAPDDRLAVTLYVLDGLPADQVAGMLGFSGAKAVYNRVYRLLADLREDLARIGLRPGDL